MNTDTLVFLLIFRVFPSMIKLMKNMNNFQIALVKSRGFD